MIKWLFIKVHGQHFVLVLVWCLLPFSVFSQEREKVIKSIVVEGAQRIEAETIRSYLALKKSDTYDPQRADRSLKKLFNTRLFADVSLQWRDGSLIVTVVENPIINRVAFEGNKRIEDKDLQNEVSLRPRAIYTRTKVQNDVHRVLVIYRRQGLFSTTVEPKIIRLPQNRVDLVFEISEGKLTDIERIRFIGNRAFGDSKLREKIRTQETRWWRWFSANDTFDPDRLTFDKELLRRFYLSEGFADVRILSAIAEMTPDRKDFFITFTIDEGPRYELDQVGIEIKLPNLKVEDLDDEVEMKSGDWYDADLVEETINRLTNRVSELGMPFVKVLPRITRQREEKKIDLSFEIREGAHLFIERIDISGNVRTLDKVIRREFRLMEGDAFNAARFQRSRERLNGLGFFSKVDMERVSGSAPDKTIIAVDVKERSTGSLMIGAGYSTGSGVFAETAIREENLLGRGQQLSLGGRLGKKRTNINLSFTEPYFMDREISAGFDIFRATSDLKDIQSHRHTESGGALRAGYLITEYLSQNWRYLIKNNKIDQVSAKASRRIKEAEGSRLMSQITHTLTYDRRDNPISPKTGYVLQMSNDFAGVGGDEKFFRTVLSGDKYYSFNDKWVLQLNLEAGYVVGLFGKDVSLFEHFTLGGTTLRGFENAGVSPRDKISGDALGGEWKYNGTVQLNFPFGLPDEVGMRGFAFTDFGSVGGLKSSEPTDLDAAGLRLSVGLGIGWWSPAGPFSISWGHPVLFEKFDKKEALRISFGTRF